MVIVGFHLLLLLKTFILPGCGGVYHSLRAFLLRRLKHLKVKGKVKDTGGDGDSWKVSVTRKQCATDGAGDAVTRVGPPAPINYAEVGWGGGWGVFAW
jgi:hypothetical protein